MLRLAIVLRGVLCRPWRDGVLGRRLDCRFGWRHPVCHVQSFYPFAATLKYYDVTAGQYVSGTVPAGDVLRPEVTVTNHVSQALSVEVRVVDDQDQQTPYDYDKTSSWVSIPANTNQSSPPIQLPTFTPQPGGQYYNRYWLTTQLANGNTPYTDTAGFYGAFSVQQGQISVSLVSATFTKGVYHDGEPITNGVYQKGDHFCRF